MILHTERLEDEYGVCEIARTLSIRGGHHALFDLIGDEGHDEASGTPACVVLDDGDEYHITLDPYNISGFRKKIKLDPSEVDCLRKILVYIDKRIKEDEGTNETSQTS